MAKSDLIHVQVEGNVFEGKSDELAKFLENGGKTVDRQGNADLWQWSISSDNKLIINEIFRIFNSIHFKSIQIKLILTHKAKFIDTIVTTT